MDTPLRVQYSDLLPPHSDKCLLPPAILEGVLQSRPDLPHPLVFQLNGAVPVYVGVKEFTAPEQTVVVPLDVLQALSASEVRVQIADLPKGSFLKLKPAQFYPHITNWKYYLESFLSTHYTVLSKNQIFYFDDKVSAITVELLVEDCNAESVVVVEANVVLDVVPLDDIMAAQQLQQGLDLAVLERIPVLEAATNLDLKPFSQVSLQHIYRINLRKRHENFTIVLECNEDNANVDLICGFDKFLTLESFVWCSMGRHSDTGPAKTIHVDMASDKVRDSLNRSQEEVSSWLYVVPFAWDLPLSATLSIATLLPEKSTQSPPEASKLCPNCDKYIQNSNFALHEAFCKRNNKKCSCGKVFEKDIPSIHWHCDLCDATGDSTLLQFKHNKLFHQGPYICQACGYDTPFASFLGMVMLHKGSVCPSKLHECRFCHLVVPQGKATYEDRYNDFTHHESECGNKTMECLKCGKTSHMLLHALGGSSLAAEEIALCANVNCVNILDGPGNELSLCEICYGPLYSNLHDPKRQKLHARIERKYILQLTKGCNQSWCNNQECATGNVKLDMKLAFLRRKKEYLEELKAEKRYNEAAIYKALSLKGLNGARQYLVESA
ncbi:hypothetical protein METBISCDRAFT_30466 [Metschnikowia bicuspidata]|uniref:Uncharacterized protein n=1 Tax=Metschnikowia bicuspidata TaxID=27322 RepID=A0A4P9ZF46_9ASCO|nr:hypothetical protein METBISCDRAFT_30466 [Metschnikowia bicuspidata]